MRINGPVAVASYRQPIWHTCNTNDARPSRESALKTERGECFGCFVASGGIY